MHRAGYVLSVVAGLSAYALQASAQERLRTRPTGQLVIAGASDKSITLVAGSNPLDRLHSFTCASAGGCLVIMAVNVDTTEGPVGSVCPQIDGQSIIKPSCVIADSVPIDTRYIANVEPGDHTIQTVEVVDQGGGNITRWEVDYSIYERPLGSN